ncbi:helix-turn-helix domain-containing protein [Planctomycetota bacterium]
MKTVAEFRNWLKAKITDIQSRPRPELDELDYQDFENYRIQAYRYAVDLGLSEAAKATAEHTVGSWVDPLLRCLEALPETRAVLTPPQVAEQLGVAPETVVTWIKNGDLKASNLAKATRPRYVVTPGDLDSFLKKRQPQPPVPIKAKVRTGYNRFSE